MEHFSISGLERQAGLLRILLILRKEGRLNFQSFIDDYGIYSTSFYRAVGKAESLGLITVEEEKSKRRTKKFAVLTDLGKEVSENLYRIESALRQKQPRPKRAD